MAPICEIKLFQNNLIRACVLANIALLMAVLMLAGGTARASDGGWTSFDPDDSQQVTNLDRLDMKLQKTATSPIAGASARVLPPPAGTTYTGAPVGACVTDTGYCPLAKQTEPGQNCLCQSADGVYGGSTGVPPKYNTATNPNP
jgi:hypothetical protein